METKEQLEEAIKDTIKKYNKIIFGPYSPVYKTCLNELQKQQDIDKKVFDQTLMDDMVRKLAQEGLQKNIVMDGDTMIDRKTGEALDLEVDSTCWQNKFYADFMAFVDYKITCRKAEQLHILNGTDTVDT